MHTLHSIPAAFSALFGLCVIITPASALASNPTQIATSETDRPQRQHPHQRLIVIAHRGASGYRPEHTLEAYRLAIRQGADFIEPDLVATKDGVLVARHENEISATTDVADRPEFAERKATKIIDGNSITGWFTEDFTLAELKTLRAKERIPDVRPGNTQYDGKEQIPTFAEVIQLAKRESRDGRKIGIYPETKHPTWFASEGRRIDGKPIHISLGQVLIDTLVAEEFTDPDLVYIQSFEVENLIELKNTIMPAANVSFALVQLYGDFESARPYDFTYNLAQGSELAAIYGGLLEQIDSGITNQTAYAALTTERALKWLRDHYAAGVGPWTVSLLPRVALDAKVDANGDGRAELSTRNTGRIHPMLGRALRAGLQVHPYTLRAEETYLTQTSNQVNQSALAEALQFYRLGVQGIFIDHPDIGVAARDLFLRTRELDTSGSHAGY